MDALYYGSDLEAADTELKLLPSFKAQGSLEALTTFAFLCCGTLGHFYHDFCSAPLKNGLRQKTWLGFGAWEFVIKFSSDLYFHCDFL